MKILHLVWGMEIGGKENFLDALVRGLSADDISQELWTCRQTGYLYDGLLRDGFKVQFLDKKSGFDFKFYSRLRQALLACKPDLIHVHDFTTAFAVTRSLRAAERCIMVATSHGGQLVPKLYEGLSDLGPIKRAIYRSLMRRMTAVTAVSARQARALARALGNGAQVTHIPYGMDPSRFTQEIDVEQKRAELNLPPGAPVVAMLARLAPPKTPKILVRAAVRVCKELPETHFLFMGDGSLRQPIEQLVNKLGLADNVHVLGMRTDVPDVLKVPDVCVLSSAREGLPLSILESMASAKPVVATAVGGVAELIEDGKQGYTFASGDSQALANHLLALLRDPEQAAEMGRRARHKLETQYSTTAMFTAYEDLYRSLAPR